MDRVGGRPVGPKVKAGDEPSAIADKCLRSRRIVPKRSVHLPRPPDSRRGRRVSVDAARGTSLPSRPEKTRSRHWIPTQVPVHVLRPLPTGSGRPRAPAARGLRPPMGSGRRAGACICGVPTGAAGGEEEVR